MGTANPAFCFAFCRRSDAFGGDVCGSTGASRRSLEPAGVE